MLKNDPSNFPNILIVDDEPDLLDLVELTLVRMGLRVERAATVAIAQTKLAQQRFDLCLTDMRLPDGEGLDVVREIGQKWPQTPVAVITAFGSTENAVAALKAGAFDYLSKPVSLEQLRALVKSALKVTTPQATSATNTELIGDAPVMRQIRTTIEKLAKSQAPVFVSGESGTGKEVAARLIHERGPRTNKPFIPVNCGAIPENLMESEFFGYRKGAFTGADADRDGFFQAANGGTLFLDEVVELPMSMQVKLLRAIQERRVRQVGGTQEVPVDVRIISASHQDLADALEAGRFRHDLFYRLNVIDMKMPPLRDRPEDIPPLVEFLSRNLADSNHRTLPVLSDDAMRCLQRYAFPGNVRELENILERAYALSDGDHIGPDDLNLAPDAMMSEEDAAARDGQSLQAYLDRVERDAILQALGKTGGNKTAAARLLGVTFRSLRYRAERLGID